MSALPTVQTAISDMTMGDLTSISGISLPPRSRSDWSPYYLDLEAMLNRLAHVKREFGLRRRMALRLVMRLLRSRCHGGGRYVHMPHVHMPHVHTPHVHLLVSSSRGAMGVAGGLLD